MKTTRVISMWIWIVFLAVCLLPAAGLADGSDSWYLLNQRMATRTGPGNTYDEPGTFFRNDYASTWVRIISKAETNVPWVQVEFTYGGKLMRAYTGAKRIAGLDLSLIPAETVLGYGTTRTAAIAYYGPGKNYAEQNHTVPSGSSCTVIQEENGYLLVEYDRVDGDYRLSRSWISADTLRGYTPRPTPSGGSSSGGSSSGSTTKDVKVREATLWWDEEPSRSYMQISDVTANTAGVFIFFYRIASVDGTVFLDGENGNHGYFYGIMNEDTSQKVQGEMWFTATGVAISMDAHQVNPAVADNALFWFEYR